MPPVREILLVAWGGVPGRRFRYSRGIAQAGVASEAYDCSRDLAIEGFFRFAAGDTHPGTHAETPNVNLVVNPSERERERENLWGSFATEPVSVSVHWTDDTVEGGENVVLDGLGVADVVLHRVQS
jgi:hypothetical protein